MKKTVLTLIDTLYPAGLETVAVTIARTLQEGDRYEPIVCATRSGGELVSVLEAYGIRYCLLERTSKLDLHKMRPLWDLIGEANVRIIHAHGVGSNIWASVLGRLRSVPVIVHIHGGGPLVR
jgi:Glycosyltransferase Family 4